MRILLDTNIWRYIVAHDALGSIQRAVRKSRHEIVIASAVVYEALHTSNSALRRSLIYAMTLPCWKRLMPEAFSEAEEIKAEVVRLRPEWLLTQKDDRLYRRLRHDWSRSRGGFWDRARHDTEREYRRIGSLPLLNAARADAKEAREAAKSMPSHWGDAPLGAMLASLPQPTPGWTVIRSSYGALRLIHTSSMLSICPDILTLSGSGARSISA